MTINNSNYRVSSANIVTKNTLSVNYQLVLHSEGSRYSIILGDRHLHRHRQRGEQHDRFSCRRPERAESLRQQENDRGHVSHQAATRLYQAQGRRVCGQSVKVC